MDDTPPETILTPTPPPQSVPPSQRNKWLLIGCAAPFVLVVACVGLFFGSAVVVGTFRAIRGDYRATPTIIAQATPSRTVAVALVASATATIGTTPARIAATLPPTATPTPISTLTATATVTPTATATTVPTATLVPTVAPLPPPPSPIPPTATPLPPTPVPPTATPVGPVLTFAELVGVQDGATVKVRLPSGEEALVLLIGIDAPIPSRECYGAEATARITELVQGRAVELEADQTDRDRDGRLLRWVWVWGDDGVRRHVNLEMAKGGFGDVYDPKPNSRYTADLNSAKQTARDGKIGLWGACGSAHAAIKSTPTPQPGIGQAVGTRNWTFRASGVERPGTILTWSQFGNADRAAGTWLVVILDIRNDGSRNFGVNAHDFDVLDGQGRTYAFSTQLGATAYSEYRGGSRVGDQVPPSVTVRYFLVFDIAPDATGLKLRFNQDQRPTITLEP